MTISLAHLPTPLEPMDRLADALGGPQLLVKRDDCTGLALGGNKARKLQALCAEAIAQRCDVLVTGGGAQSNHVRMTAAAANRIGLDCHVAVATDRPAPGDVGPGGNLLLDEMLGAKLEFVGPCEYYELESAIETLGARLVREGHKPYLMPIGGASITGVSAYADAADELRVQLAGDPVDWVVVADGSGGTHAGLVAGFGGDVRVLGVDVGTRPDLDAVVPRLAQAAAARSGRASPPIDVLVDHDNFGDGYGAVSQGATEAILLAARLEGLVLDPVYTGKAMAGLIEAVRDGRITRDETVVFWHTGGAPALFATRYATVFRAEGPP